jgi:hypothetical protein
MNMSKTFLFLLIFILGLSNISTTSGQERNNWRLYRSKKNKEKEAEKEVPVTPTQYVAAKQTSEPTLGVVNIYEDYRMSKMVELYKDAYSTGKIDGYRVQLFFGNRDSARETKTTFLKKYPTTRADVTYLAPNFRVRVGSFRTILEAEKFKNELQDLFPSCYIVPEKIALPSLKIK